MFNETEFIQFALPFFVKALGLSEDDIKEKSMSPEGQQELQKLYGENRKAAKSEGYKEAVGKIQKTLNKQAKDLFGVETDATSIEETVQAIKENYKPEGDQTPAEITDNAVKRHPLYLRMETAKNDAEKALNDSKTDFDQRLRTALDTGLATLNLQANAESALATLKARLPAHDGQKRLAITAYKQSFDGIEQKTVDGKTYFYDKEGNRLEDDMGSPLNWDALVRKQAESFFELEGPDRESPAAKPNQQQQQQNRPGNVNLQPRTMEELNKVLENTSVKAEDRSAAMSFYKANGTDLQG